ncbi:MAG: hypothetical protein AAFX53_18760 [Bacteroidota bacterium]
MGKLGKFFGTLVLFGLFLFGHEAVAHSFYDNSDPRVQLRDQKVMLTFLNKEGDNYTVKVYSPKNLLIRWEELGDTLVVGKILDFENSRKGIYRVQVSSEGDVLFDERLRLGNL